MRRSFLVALVVLPLLTFLVLPPLYAAPPSQAAQTVRVGQVDISAYPRVTLYVDVLDANGNPVSGLKPADLQLSEDGTPVKIEEWGGLDERRPVDIVFVFDTTSSMGGAITGVRQRCVDFVNILDRQGRDYRLGLVTFGDAVRQVYPESGLTGSVNKFVGWLDEISASEGGSDPENSYGAVKRAAAMPFRANAQRVLILITDASPHHQGDAPDSEGTFEDPVLNVDPTLGILHREGIVAYVVGPDIEEYRRLATESGGQFYPFGDDFTTILDSLGQQIAGQYRLTYRSPKAVYDRSVHQVEVAVGGVKGSGSYTTPGEPISRARGTDFFGSLQTPLDLSLDPAVIGTNLALAGLLALLFGLTSTIMNDTLNENRDAFAGSAIGRFFALLGKVVRAVTGRLGKVSFQGKKVMSYVQVGLFLLLTALAGCFLDPSFLPLSWAGVGLFVSMLLSVSLVNLVYEGSQVMAARRFHLDAALKLNPLGLLVAAGCVLFSRLVGFTPGYLYGVAGGYALGAAVDLSRRREATISGAGLGAAMALALLAWGLSAPSVLLQESLGTGGVAGVVRGLSGGVQNFLLTIFFVGLELVFLELFPVGPTNGAKLFDWNKVVWGICFGVAAFMACQLLLTPESAYLDVVRNQSVQLLLGLLALYSLVAVGLWYLFEARKRAPAQPACPACGTGNPIGSRFCGECGVALPAVVPTGSSRRGVFMVVVIASLWVVIIVAVLMAALQVA